MFHLAQRLPSRWVASAEELVVHAMQDAGIDQVIASGDRVAIAVGSRGIANLETIVRQCVAELVALGANPFVVPAMGSHGSATDLGQAKVLRSLSITPQSVGCPIVSSMETEIVGDVGGWVANRRCNIHFDRHCLGADHVIVVNRVKPHTRITGKLQSGLTKMALIGLGKQAGAIEYHRQFGATGYQIDPIAEPILQTLIQSTPLRFGLAIVEDAIEQTSHIECVPVQKWLRREPDLLQLASHQMPGLPFDQVDFLMVNQIGKEISGCGLDTNVIGRKFNDLEAMPEEWPKVAEIYVRQLSKRTEGNATGVGLAKYVHERVIEQMDLEMTRINCETGDHASAGRIHQVVRSDLEAMGAAIHSGSHQSPASSWRWMAIKDTLSLSSLWCSESYWEAAQVEERLQVLSEPEPMSFDDSGQWSVWGLF